MFCEKCGANVAEDSAFCPVCGAPMGGSQPQQMQAGGWGPQPMQGAGWGQQQNAAYDASYPETTWIGAGGVLDENNHTVQMIPSAENDKLNKQLADQWNQANNGASGGVAVQQEQTEPVYNYEKQRWECQGQWYNQETQTWLPIEAPVKSDPVPGPGPIPDGGKSTDSNSDDDKTGSGGKIDLYSLKDEEAQSGKKKKKLFIILGAVGGALLLLAAAAVVWLFVLGGTLPFVGAAKGSKPAVFSVAAPDGLDYLIAPEAEVSVNERLNNTSRSGFYMNADRSAVMLMIDSEIWLYDGKEIRKVRELTNLGTDENDNSYIVGFGSYGRDIFYVDNGSLFLYRDGQATRVSNSGALKDEDKSKYGCVTSPDGKYVAYCVPEDDGSFRGYVWDGNGNYEIGKNDLPLAISNGGKYLFYLDISNKTGKKSLVVRKGINGTEEQSLGSSENDINCYFNSSGTEVLFRTEDKYYLSFNGESSQKIFNGTEVQLVLPYGVKAVLNGNSGLSASVGVSSFKDFCIMESDILYRIDSKGTVSRIAKHVTRAYAASDKKTIIYSDDSHNLYRINAAKTGAAAEMIVNGDCYDFVPTADGKTVFFLNKKEKGALMCRKNGKNIIELAEQPSSSLGYDVLLNGSTIAFIQEDEFYLTNGEKTNSISGLDQKILEYSAGSGYILLDGEKEILYSADGVKFIVVFKK